MATQAKRDYYEVLGVTRTASPAEIRDAFQALARTYHANGKPANIDAVEQFREVARAYRVLGDPEQRQRYDKFGESGVINSAPESGYDPDELEKWIRQGADSCLLGYGRHSLDPEIVNLLNNLVDLDMI